MKKRSLVSCGKPLLFISFILAVEIEWVGGVPSAFASEEKSLNSTQNSAWSLRMQQMYQSLSELLTLVASDPLYNDVKNKKKIETEVEHFTKLTHELNEKSKNAFDNDATLPFVSGLLMKRANQALFELKNNQRDQARILLKSLPGYCITCHSRNGSGPQFTALPMEPTQSLVSSFEKGEFYFATRQYDRAMDEFKKIISDETISASMNYNWERSVYRALTISVRVKNDPTLTKDLIQNILKMKNAPASLLSDAQAWKKTTEEWLSENQSQKLTDEMMLEKALKLMGKAKEIQKYPMDRTADVYYLRASAIAHEILQKYPKGKKVGDALLLVGISYEVLAPLKSENLHDFYYESCIREVPHSITSELCYLRMEQSLISGFTGSRGTDVPEEVRTRLTELRKLSKQPDSAVKKIP